MPLDLISFILPAFIRALYRAFGAMAALELLLDSSWECLEVICEAVERGPEACLNRWASERHGHVSLTDLDLSPGLS
jgi:hypothetical protein